LKFTEKGSVSVNVALNAAHVMIEIKDTGRGISDEDQGRLFNSYTQIQHFETRTIVGTGLGLSLSQQLVSLLGGEMGLSSRLGEGSIFWFTLPLEQGKVAMTDGKP
jgi:two-component system sensor histidine kinase/response regulator